MSFSLVCQMSHKKKSVKGEPKLAEFTLDTLFVGYNLPGKNDTGTA